MTALLTIHQYAWRILSWRLAPSRSERWTDMSGPARARPCRSRVSGFSAGIWLARCYHRAHGFSSFDECAPRAEAERETERSAAPSRLHARGDRGQLGVVEDQHPRSRPRPGMCALVDDLQRARQQRAIAFPAVGARTGRARPIQRAR